jgi:tetratricopeptide (TPR) repeat protein
MKKTVFTILFLSVAIFTTTSLQAQIQTPAASTAAKIEQTVGLTDISIEYSRPGKKGRELFVDVEKWGKMWRTGANASTKISFSTDVKIEGNDVPAGTYAIYSIPDKENWTVMLYKDLKLGGNVAKYDKAQEQASFQVKTVMLDVEMENFAFLIDEIKDNSAIIGFTWGKYYVPFKLEVDVDSDVMASIESTMNGPSRNDYYQAARYYFKNDKDIEQALAWAKKANEIGPRYWQLRLEAQIHAKMGDSKRAIAKITESTTAAKEAGNNDYAAANEKMAEEWRKM